MLMSSAAERAGLFAAGGVAAWACLNAQQPRTAGRSKGDHLEAELREDLAAAREQSHTQQSNC
jgi:hypothetical protein